MNTKVFRFILWLLALMLVFFGLYRLIMKDTCVPSLIWQIGNTLYYFTPALAVLMVEKWEVKKIFSSYRLTVNGMNVKKGIQYVLATAFVVPLLMLIFTYILGNLLGAKCFGEITTSVPFLSGIALPTNSFLRPGILYLITSALAFLSGLIIQFFVLGGEIAWRGFLEQHLTLSPVPKTLLIGLLWGLWHIPFIVAFKVNFTDIILTFGEVLLFCMVCSFYLRGALRQTRTLFAPAAMLGAITSLPLPLFLVWHNEASSLLNGTHGLLTVISIACVHIAFTWIKPIKMKQ